MKQLLSLIILIMMVTLVKSQSVTQIKKELDTTRDPIGYVKYKLKKKYKIDTVTVMSTSSFLGLADSLAYKGKIGKVYGPFKGANYLIKVLAKVPNTFYHVSHILIDTSTFSRSFADSLASNIIKKIKTDSSTFETMARTYSADNATAAKGGNLGWFIRGAMLPQLDDAIAAHKKGDIFKVWTPAGLHVVTITDNPKKDNGFALLLRVFL
ncbi:MAG: peptidylprolyl isomerase [Aquabacterium sp.]|nr:peptidylprolyl isomerase [Ferruginibacter sp.]